MIAIQKYILIISEIKFMILRILMFFTITPFMSHVVSGQSLENNNEIQKYFEELNIEFSIDGKTVNPLIIYHFTGGDADMSDGPGIYQSVNILEAQESNTFYCDSCLGTKQFYFEHVDGRYYGEFLYEYHGRTLSGVHVVSTSCNGGGTGVWGSILFLKVVKKNSIRNGVKCEIICLDLIGEAPANTFFGRHGRENSLYIDKNRVSIVYINNELDAQGIEKITTEVKEYEF